MLIDFRYLFPKYNINPKGVLHVGANIGEEAPVYHALGIQRMTFIEANPEIFDKLVTNISIYPGANAFNYCVGDEDRKPVKFNISNNGSQSSSLLELGTHTVAHPEVHYIKDMELQMRRLDKLFDDKAYEIFPMDFLNMDLQGAELMALRGMGDTLRYFKWAYLEVNQAELYKGCPHVNDLDLFMNGFHFKRVETRWCGNTGWGDALYIRR